MLPSRGGRNALIAQIGLSLLLFSKRVAAQVMSITPQQPQQNVTECVGTWDLLMDDPDIQGENPCQGVITAMSQCEERPYILPDISTQSLGLFPVPSVSANTTQCECNEVAYNLFQACAACQRGADTTLSRHDAWFQNCPNNQSIPIQPPGYIENTFWATQVYIQGFNVSEALVVESTHQPPPSQPVDSSGGGAAATAVPSAMSATANKSSSNTGAIAGGVVGGIIFLAIIIVGIFFFMRRKRSRTAPSKEFMRYAPVNQAIIPAHDEESASFHNQNPQPPIAMSQQQLQQQQQRNSGIRQDSGISEEMETLPGFTPGLFKDPIFEKGAALNIASHHVGYSGNSASPVTYSPATPSTTFHTNEGQRLLQSRQPSGS